MRALQWSQNPGHQSPIIKVPLQFTFPPVEILMKELTKLNSPHPYRIVYLGPRWDNSVAFHKKYSSGGAYDFKDRKVSKNTSFLHDSMIHNQFYKNEIYYRAFEGMNPTIDLAKELAFQSRFQGGNLDCVVKINDNQYDLFLRIDSNTRGHIFWFYFAVKNMKKGQRVRLNLANLTKNDTHYTKGLNPYMYSSRTKEWTQDGMTGVTFKQKRLRYEFLYEKLRIRNFYELSFQVESAGEEELRFAYCIPYTYSDLLRDVKEVQAVAEVGSLGQSLTGINIPMVMVGKHEEGKNKPVLLLTGRVHPGESNSSIILAHLMKFLCHSPQAKYLREKILTIIVPMTNPDGVILGNSRCGASGKDLNREFKTNSRALFPEIVLLKNLVDKISQTHDVDLYLDFHGHSRKKNMFIFGPSYNLTQPQYYKCRVFPKLLSNFTTIFRYYSCSYDIPYQKRSTARAVMLNQIGVPFVYTVECSLGFYHDYFLHKDAVFTRKKWEELGESVTLALKEYYQGIQQYDQYIQCKKKAKKYIAEEIKIVNTANTSVRRSQRQSKDAKETKQTKEPKETKETKQYKQPKKQLKDLRFVKLFEEIKELQEKRGKQEKKEKDSDNQSDSNDEKEDLQKQKMHEFAGMVTEFVQEENRLLNNKHEKTHSNLKRPQIDKKATRRQQRKQQREERFKYQETLLKDLSEQKKVVTKRFQVKSQSKNRYRPKEEPSIRKDRTEMISQQIRKHKEINLKSRQKRLILHQYLDQQVNFVSVQKKNSKSNVRMFNFSKMIQVPKSMRYQDHKQYIRVKDLSHNFLEKNTELSSQFSNYSSNFQEQGRPTYMNLQNMVEQHHLSTRKEPSIHKHNTDDLKHVKGRNGFPSSFYRIKYHNNQRRKQEYKKERQLYEYEEYQKIHQYNTQNNLNGYAVKEEQEIEEAASEDGLFLKVRKFPVF